MKKRWKRSSSSWCATTSLDLHQSRLRRLLNRLDFGLSRYRLLMNPQPNRYPWVANWRPPVHRTWPGNQPDRLEQWTETWWSLHLEKTPFHGVFHDRSPLSTISRTPLDGSNSKMRGPFGETRWNRPLEVRSTTWHNIGAVVETDDRCSMSLRPSSMAHGAKTRWRPASGGRAPSLSLSLSLSLSPIRLCLMVRTSLMVDGDVGVDDVEWSPSPWFPPSMSYLGWIFT